MIPDFDNKKRYKVTGEYDAENRVMYFDMTTAEKSNFRNNAGKTEYSVKAAPLEGGDTKPKKTTQLTL